MAKRSNSFLRQEQLGPRRTGPHPGKKTGNKSGMTRDDIVLTPNELTALRLSARGKSVADIAKELKISRRSAKTLRQNVKTKFGLRSGAGLDEMLVLGRRLGFIQ